VTEKREDLWGIYRFTSIARPIDPAYLTNRALIVVLPVVGVLSASLAYVDDSGGNPISAGLSAVLVAFAAWALTRELAPDYSGAAFVALAFAWAGNIVFGTRLVLLVFVAIALVRVVNRSTGLPLRPLDTIGVLGFCIWAAMVMEQPLILTVASVAFLLDARLENPLRRHYLAAALCLLIFLFALPLDMSMTSGELSFRDWSLIGASALGVVLFVTTSPEPVSYCDVSPDRLDPLRVNAGLIVGWLLAVQALLSNGSSAWLETPIWACMIALLLSLVVRQVSGFRRSWSQS
jgi:hypothetical protein